MKLVLLFLISVSLLFSQSQRPADEILPDYANVADAVKSSLVNYKYIGGISSPRDKINRIVYIESGTNTSCGYCATYNPYLKQFATDNPDSVIVLTYHAWWPGSGDPFYTSNSGQNSDLVNHNGVNGVPNYKFDGVYDVYPIDLNKLNVYTNLRKNIQTPVEITVTDTLVGSDSIKATVTVDVLEKLTEGDYRLRIFATDRIRNFASPPGNNGEKQFEYIFRRAYPDVAGTSFNGDPGQHVFTVTYEIEAAWNGGLIYTTAYLQNDSNKEVLNADRSARFNATQPSACFLPEDGGVVENFTFDLQWYPSYNATSYGLQISDDESFANPVVDETGLTVTTYAYALNSEGEKKYWRVNATGDETTEYSSAWTFVAPLFRPDNVQLTNNGTSIELSWQDHSSLETSFELERAITQGIGMMFKKIATLNANELTYTDNDVSKTGIYKYRLKAINDDSFSPYSDTASTTITSVEENELSPEKFELAQNYPNPFNPSTKIAYSLPVTTEGAYEVKLTVYDAIGKFVATLVNNQQNAGTYEVVFNAAELSSGVYYYRLEANELVQTRKLVLIK